MRDILKELEKVDRMSVLIIKYFSLISITGIIIGCGATVIFKNVETGRYLLMIAAGLMAEGIWGGILLDCIKRR